MTFPGAFPVDSLGIPHVQGLQCAMQSVIRIRGHHQVNVIGHQAIGQNVNVIPLTVFLQPLQIGLSIFIREEHILAAIASLRDVMRNSSKHRSG